MSRQALLSDKTLLKQSKGNGELVHWAQNLTDEIPIYLSPTGIGSVTPITSHDYLFEAQAEVGKKNALGVKRGGQWVYWTYAQYYQDCRTFARALISQGIPRRTCINIIGFNAPEWLISFMGASFADIVPVGIYATNGVEACQYIEQHSEARLIVCQNVIHLQKYLSYWTPSSKVQAFVVYENSEDLEVISTGKPIYSWEQFMAMGDLRFEEELQKRVAGQNPCACNTLVYTSGTTGPPKGVMLTHDNMIWPVRVLQQMGEDIMDNNERIVSYLPLSHSAAQMTDIYQSIMIRATVYFADETALQGTLLETLKEVRPTVFFSVPRIFEKMEEAFKAAAAQKSDFVRSIGTWAKGVGYEASLRQAQKQDPPFSYRLAHPLILNNVKKAVGLDAVKVLVVSAAPIPRSTLEYMLSLNFLLFNCYGMSETGGPSAVNLHGYSNLFSSGKYLPGTELKIVNEQGEQVPQGQRGEICIRGRNKFMGYYKQPEQTMKVIDSEGWIHSGDEGYLDENDFLFLTGRFKELIITKGGENIAPVPIEQYIKEKCKLVSNVFLVGDDRRFLSALITLKSVIDPPTMEPTNELPDECKRILAEINSPATTVDEARECDKVATLVENTIKDYNLNESVSRAQNIQKWVFLPGDFTLNGGELTPTMKIKRTVVAKKYASYIDPLYEEAKLQLT